MGTHTLQKAKFSDIVKYSFGGIGSNLAFILVLSYLTFFYTDVFGLDSFTVAGLMMVARLIDAFTDPLMGMIADNTRSKIGRFRPYILFGAPFLGLSLFMLFTAPNLSTGGKVIYAYVVYIGYSLISTVVNIPYHSLTPAMSEDPQQRTVIVSWKQGMSIIPQFVVGSLALPIVGLFSSEATGWSVYGAIIGVATTLSFWVCAWGGKKYDTLEKAQVTSTGTKVNFWQDIKVLFKNKPMVMLMIAVGTDLLAATFASSVNMYYFKYVLGRPDLIPAVSTISLATGILAIPTIPYLCKWLGKKRLCWWMSLFCIVPNALLMFIPNPTLAILGSMLGVYTFLSRITGTLGWAMLPDCVDWAEWKFGKRTDGLTSSSLTFINKFTGAFGASLASLILGTMGFVANQDQSAAVNSMIVFMRFGLPIIGYICSLISLRFYEITEEKLKEVNAELQERRAARLAK